MKSPSAVNLFWEEKSEFQKCGTTVISKQSSKDCFATNTVTDRKEKIMKGKNFEKELPSGYRQAYYIDAANKKTGLIFNLVALMIMALVMLLSAIPVIVSATAISTSYTEIFIALIIYFVAMLGYIILHELVHGAAYKLLTGEKLTYGMKWSCAFCGVPHIYTYRRAAIIAILSPLVVFTFLLLPITVLLYFVNPVFYFLSALILGLHLGGCCGDAFVFLLLIFKFKDKSTLIRDTGPTQYFYIQDGE